MKCNPRCLNFLVLYTIKQWSSVLFLCHHSSGGCRGQRERAQTKQTQNWKTLFWTCLWEETEKNKCVLDSSLLAEESGHTSGRAVTFRLGHNKLTSLHLLSDSGQINPKSLERSICPNSINYQRPKQHHMPHQSSQRKRKELERRQCR